MSRTVYSRRAHSGRRTPRCPVTERDGKSLFGLLGEFEQLRAENLEVVRGWDLTDAELSLDGQHPVFGSVTLRQLLATWVTHDLSHIAQVARVMARQYRDAVGPWREYLPILDLRP